MDGASREGETEILYRLTGAVNRAATPGDVFGPSLDAICAGLRVERAAILLVDEAGSMRFAAWRGLSDGYRTAVEGHTPWDAGASDWPTIVVPDALREPAMRSFRAAFEREGIGALAFVPLVHSGQLLGTFMVYAGAPRVFTEAELRFATTTASHVSQAVARSRLHAMAEAANRAKDEFISLLGHELRNPLSPIVTALHLMRQKDDSAFPRERRVIERQVQHLSRLVDDLLDVTRIARGLVELRRVAVNLERVIRDAVDMAAPLLEERQQHLELALAPELVVHGDEARLAQVVSNLVHNAAKFTPRGGHVAVRAEAVGGEAVIRVVDDGKGMEPSFLPRVFELFTLGAAADGEPRSGLGLGLSIVRSLVELHGGRVEAHSDGLGRGAAFVVSLPLLRDALPAGAPAQAPPSPGRGRRVLVVDDNVDAANLLCAALAGAGHAVERAYDGPSALRLAEAQLPEVALLDIGLPVMDGYELAGRLRALPGLAELRLVAVTGYGREEDRERAIRAGFEAHLAKPVDVERVLALVSAGDAPVRPG